MYKHILIPTDGSELSRQAIDHGIALAKSVNGKVTAMTVTVPFHVFSIEPGMATNTPERYKKKRGGYGRQRSRCCNGGRKGKWD